MDDECSETRECVAVWDTCGGDGVDVGVVVAVTFKASRGDQLQSLAMVVVIEFGVDLIRGLYLYQMSTIFPFGFPL